MAWMCDLTIRTINPLAWTGHLGLSQGPLELIGFLMQKVVDLMLRFRVEGPKIKHTHEKKRKVCAFQ